MQQLRKPNPDRGTTVTIHIDPATFTATKREPMINSGFRIYRLDEKIVIEKVNGPQGAKSQRYTLEEGSLNLVLKPNAAYAYFRSNKFQAFLDKFGINRVRYMDPNGEYQGRTGQFKNNVDSFAVITDGESVLSENSKLLPDQEPLYSVRFASLYVNLTGAATFALAQQVTVKQSDDGKETTFKLRELITTGDIYSLEEVLLGPAAELDAIIADLLV
jgi:hypothetical protein